MVLTLWLARASSTLFRARHVFQADGTSRLYFRGSGDDDLNKGDVEGGKLIFLECQRRDINTQLCQLVTLDTGTWSSYTQPEDVPWGTHLITIHRAGGERLAAKNHGTAILKRGNFLLVGLNFFTQYKCIIDYLTRTLYFTLGHDTISLFERDRRNVCSTATNRGTSAVGTEYI